MKRHSQDIALEETSEVAESDVETELLNSVARVSNAVNPDPRAEIALGVLIVKLAVMSLTADAKHN